MVPLLAILGLGVLLGSARWWPEELVHAVSAGLRLLAIALAHLAWFSVRAILRLAWWVAVGVFAVTRWSLGSFRHFALALLGLLVIAYPLALVCLWIAGMTIAIRNAITRTLLGWLPHWSAPSVGHVSLPDPPRAALLGIPALIVALLVVRAIMTHLTARSRVAYAVLPPSSFDPAPAAIHSFAAHLVGMRRRLVAWVDRPASAFRVRLTTTGSAVSDDGRETVRAGRPLMVWEFPSRFRSLLSTVASSYPSVNLVPLDEFEAPPPAPLTGPRHSVCLELEPANELYPLRQQPYPSEKRGVDPLQSAASALRQVVADRGDRLEIAVDLLPLAPREGARARRRLIRKARRFEKRGASDAAETVKRRLHRQGVVEKAEPALPLFALQVLVHAEAPCTGEWWRRAIPGMRCCAGEERARSMAGRVFACFDQFAGQNYLRARGVSLFGLVHLGASLPGARHWFEARLRRGLMG